MELAPTDPLLIRAFSSTIAAVPTTINPVADVPASVADTEVLLLPPSAAPSTPTLLLENDVIPEERHSADPSTGRSSEHEAPLLLLGSPKEPSTAEESELSHQQQQQQLVEEQVLLLEDPSSAVSFLTVTSVLNSVADERSIAASTDAGSNGDSPEVSAGTDAPTVTSEQQSDLLSPILPERSSDPVGTMSYVRKETEKIEAETQNAVLSVAMTPKSRKAVTFSESVEDQAEADKDDESSAATGNPPRTSSSLPLISGSVASITDTSVDESTAEGSLLGIEQETTATSISASERSAGSAVSGESSTRSEGTSEYSGTEGQSDESDSDSSHDSETSFSRSTKSASQSVGTKATTSEFWDDSTVNGGENGSSRLVLSFASSVKESNEASESGVMTATVDIEEEEMVPSSEVMSAREDAARMKSEAVMPAKFKIGIPNPDEMRHDPAFWLSKSLADMSVQEKRMYRIARLRLLHKEAELSKRVKNQRQMREELIEDAIDFFAPAIEKLQPLIERVQPYVDKVKPAITKANQKLYQVASKCFTVLDEMTREYRGAKMIDIARFEQVLRSVGTSVKKLKDYSASYKISTVKADSTGLPAPRKGHRHHRDVLDTMTDMIEELEYRCIEDEVAELLQTMCASVANRSDRSDISDILSDLCGLIEQKAFAQEITDRIALITLSSDPSAIKTSTVPTATEEAYSEYDFNAIVSKLKGDQLAAIKAVGLNHPSGEEREDADEEEEEEEQEEGEEEENSEQVRVYIFFCWLHF